MNPSILYQIPGQQNTNNILNGSSSSAFNSSYGKQPDTTSNAGDVLSGINGLAQHPLTQTAAPENGNWLTRLIPTLGSIGGGILGGIGGSFVAPVAGSFAGGIAGSAAGDALGKTIENAIEGKNTTAGDLGGAALEGAGGQLLGAGIGKGIGALGGAIGSIGAKGLAKEGQIAADANTLASSKNVTSLFGKDAANGVDQGFNKAKAFTDSIGHDITSNPAEAKSSIDAMLNHFGNARQEALQNSGNINVAGKIDANGNVIAPSIQDVLMNAFNKTSDNGTTTSLADQLGGLGAKAEAAGPDVSSRFVASFAPTNGKTPATDLLKEVKTAVSPLFKSGGYDSVGNIPATTVQDSLSSVNKLRDSAFNELQKAGTDASTAGKVPALQAKLDYISNVKSGLEDMLYNRPEFTNALGESVGKPSGLLDNLRALGPQGEAMASASEQVNPITGGKDFNKNFSDLINAQKVLEPAAAKYTSPTSDYARLQATPNATGVDASGNPIVDSLAKSGHPIANLLGSTLKIGTQGGVAGRGAVSLGSILQRIAPMAGAVTGKTITNSPNYTGAAGADTAIGENMTPTGIGATGNPVADILNSSSPNTVALKQLLTLEENGGGYNVPQEMSMFAAPAADELKSLNGVNSAQSQLASLIDLYNKAGGAQGPIGGLLSKLGGAFTGSPAGQYDSQAAQLADQISQLTGTRVNAPSLTMDKNAANGVLAQLQAALASYGGGGGVSSLGR